MRETSPSRPSLTRRVSIPLVVESSKEARPSTAERRKRRSSRVMIIGDGYDDDDDVNEVFEDGQIMTSFAKASGKI